MSSTEGESPLDRAPRKRKFLVVVDGTPEARVALRFAARRAQHTDGRVSLLVVVAPPDAQQWKAVEDVMREEAHQEAERLIHEAAKSVFDLTAIRPELLVREGRPREALSALIAEDRDISILVLAARKAKDGPGPLITAIAESGSLYPIPVTIVPGDMGEREIDAIS